MVFKFFSFAPYAFLISKIVLRYLDINGRQAAFAFVEFTFGLDSHSAQSQSEAMEITRHSQK
jgi:hypothetical protein